ncbi:MAG TPA: serine/threonine-protein kinase, partial [Polyangia bacterium]|nr:serine/threonine-protein kinase [Polyangia bacterium]
MPEPPRSVGSPQVSRVDTLPEALVKLITSRPLFVGDVVAGRYKLMQTLGDGAMGQVFVAENLAIGQKVALKLLKTELLADPTFRMRFQQEAEAIAAVEHRNVARFLDLVVGDPTFIVMEYVRGPTLAQVIRDKKRLPAIDAMYIAERLCWALEAAHQRGVVHRDIKPSNVILCPDAENEIEPKLIDFGLAKVAAATNEKGLTRTGQIVGTPDYMSPEQIANKEVDARSDVYSLGCLMFEMCVGHPPFTGGDDVQVLYQQLQVKPDKVEDHVPDAPPEVDRVLTKALAKEPGARFQSMREMAEALARARRRVYRSITGEMTADIPRSTQRVPGAIPSRWTTRVSWPLVALLVAIVGGAAGFLFSRLTKPAPVAAPVGGGILVVTRPAGATIDVDGVPFGETSPTMVPNLGAGAHTIKLRKGKLGIVERQVTLAAGEHAVVNVVLPPASHKVEVRSVPEGATVYLDDRVAVGETPTTIEVTDDEFHELKVVKVGYETGTRALTPDDHDPVLTMALPAERQPRGTLLVDANTAAEVWMDGVDTGYTTPTLGIHEPLGEHLVEVRDGAGHKASTKVTLTTGQTIHLLLSPGGK